MLFAFIKQLFQKVKHCLYRLFSQIVQNVDEENLVDGDKLMVAEKKILFTESEYKELIAKFPAVYPAIIKDTKGDSDTTYYLKSIKDLHEIRKRDGIEAIPDECIEYVKYKKSKTSPRTDSKNTQKAAKKTQSQTKSSSQPAVTAKESDEVFILADDKKVEATKSLELNTENIDTKGIGEQAEITSNQQFVNSEEPNLEILEDSTIQQILDASENLIDSQEKLTTWRWRRLFDAVVGSSHLRADPPIPCQDSALAVLIPRPAIFVADGAGSARLSHLGSSAVVRYLNRFTASLEDINQKILDEDRQEDTEIDKQYADRFIKYAIEILKELSEAQKEPIALFKCTLLITIIGKKRLFWLKVGDGFIVIEKAGSLELIGPLGKGDFANQTTFLTEYLNEKDIHYGFIDIHNVTGVTAFTDGAGEKLVSNNGLQITGFLGRTFQGMRTGEFIQENLNEFLSKKELWIKTTGDDKGIAILSCLE